MECDTIITRLSRRNNLKKTIFLVVILLLSTACTKLSKRSEIGVDNQRLTTFYSYYNSWELEKARLELNQLGIEEKDENILMQKLTTRETNKAEFKQVQKIHRNALKANDFDVLEKYVALNIINEIKLRELKKNDYSKVKIYFAKNKFYRENAESLMLVNYFEETFYIDLKFELIDESKWKLVSFNERR
jgi:hypothetical protein